MCIKRLVKIPHRKFHENLSVGIAQSREVRRADGLHEANYRFS